MTERKILFTEYEQPTSDFTVDNITPFGWNLFIMDVNFVLTRKIADIIEKINGVESTEYLSRYKMRVGIGEMFDEDAVKEEIIEAIYNSFEVSASNIEQERMVLDAKVENKKSSSQIQFENYRKINYKYDYFATIFIKGDSPNTLFVSGNNKEEVESELEKIIETNKDKVEVMKTWN